VRYLTGLVIVVFVITHMLSYAEEKPGSLDKFLKNMRTMVGKIVPKKSGPQGSTAVSGVRGAEADFGDPLYWKGKRNNVTDAELAEFNDALTSAEQGKKDEATIKFENFLKKYPSSELAGDAKNTLTLLKSS
jgi:TolA-binding protein